MQDIEAHRKNHNYSNTTFLKRILWNLASVFFYLSPRHLYSFRNLMLRCFGAKIGQAVQIYPSAKIFYPWNFEIRDYSTIGHDVRVYSLGKIIIGSNVMISQGVHLCAGSHDYRQTHLPLTTKSIVIKNGVWICSEAFIGPGVQIDEDSVIGARSVVFKNVAAGLVVCGNPIKVISSRK